MAKLKSITIFVANPKDNSFSHQLAHAYSEGASQTGKMVTLIDLYDPDFALGFLKPETRSEYERNQPIRERLQAAISEADELVFVHPLWWGGPPAILKNMIDQVFTPGFAYKRVKRPLIPRQLDIVPQRLLRGKRVRLLITCDGKRWTNMARMMPYLGVWNGYVFRFTGLKLSSFHLFDDMRGRDGFWRGKHLARINKLAAKI
jgi:NAD(P)H dehydrogenase (quinone)